jgi:uncharacterized protein YihD (DUF1040 family)
MRNPERIEPMIALIRKIWYRAPDLRLTQLIMNALKMNDDPYYVEDDKLKKALEEYIEKVEE